MRARQVVGRGQVSRRDAPRPASCHRLRRLSSGGVRQEAHRLRFNSVCRKQHMHRVCDPRARQAHAPGVPEWCGLLLGVDRVRRQLITPGAQHGILPCLRTSLWMVQMAMMTVP